VGVECSAVELDEGREVRIVIVDGSEDRRAESVAPSEGGQLGVGEV
jgi:hypothetical protein